MMIKNYLTSGMRKDPVFFTHVYESKKHIRTTFVLVKGNYDTIPVVWVATILLLFRINAPRYFIPTSISFYSIWKKHIPSRRSIQYWDKCVFNGLCKNTLIDDNMQVMISTGQSGPVSVKECFGVAPFASIQVSIHSIRKNFAIQRFTP